MSASNNLIENANKTQANQAKPRSRPGPKQRRRRLQSLLNKDQELQVTSTSATGAGTQSNKLIETEPPNARYLHLGNSSKDPQVRTACKRPHPDGKYSGGSLASATIKRPRSGSNHCRDLQVREAIKRPRPNLSREPKPKTATKRACPVGNQPLRGDPKKQRVGGPTKSAEYIDALNTNLIAVITEADRDSLTKPQADEVLGKIEALMFAESAHFDTNIALSGPEFRGKPVFTDCTLQVWCANERTVKWLKRTIDKLNLESGANLRICVPSDLPRRVKCGVLVPKKQEAEDIVRMLKYQNPWAEINRWRILTSFERDNGTVVVVSIPEDLIGKIINHKRMLGFYLGSVYIKFAGSGGKFVVNPPYIHQTATEPRCPPDIEDDPTPPMDSVCYQHPDQESNSSRMNTVLYPDSYEDATSPPMGSSYYSDSYQGATPSSMDSVHHPNTSDTIRTPIYSVYYPDYYQDSSPPPRDSEYYPGSHYDGSPDTSDYIYAPRGDDDYRSYRWDD